MNTLTGIIPIIGALYAADLQQKLKKSKTQKTHQWRA